MKYSIAILISFLLLRGVAAQDNSAGKQLNILFIAIDDLKPVFKSYGSSVTITPNFDKLSETATVFTGAYCQQAVCAPTRASLLTGLRPDKTKVWDLKTLIRDKNPDIVTLPQYFKMNGYRTIGMGKIFDQRSVDKEADSVSWSVPYKKKFIYAAGYEEPAFGMYQDPTIREKEKAGVKLGSGDDAVSEAKKPTECMDVPDDAYTDGAMANFAVSRLKELKNGNKPFFLAVGFRKPHLPFIAPKKYWDLYDRNKIELATWQKKSINGPDIAFHNSGELRSYADIKSVNNTSDLLILEDSKQRELIHGYYAAISYIDAQVGKLLDALKENGLDKNTIVVIWGDHGWHLGDHSLWNKHSNFEQATHVPLFIKVPGVINGKKYSHPAEFVDIFPTLCDLTGLKTPSDLDGVSLLPALKGSDIPVKAFAISQYPRASKSGSRDVMGYSLRGMQYRFTEWVDQFISTEKIFNPKDLLAIELYDLANDPNETINLASDPKMKTIVENLSQQLHEYYAQQYKTRR